MPSKHNKIKSITFLNLFVCVTQSASEANLSIFKLGLTKHYYSHSNTWITVSEETTCFGLVRGCHSRVPMPGDWSQYGILIPMTDKRASQVSHSSLRTKASHIKSRLIPGPWAPPTRKTIG